VAGLLVATSGRWSSYLALLGLILAYGAVITSLGLALATWVCRLGRAVALCISAYVVFSIGWLVIVALFFTTDQTSLPLVLGSPPYGILFATASVSPGQDSLIAPATTIALSALVWIIVDAGIALLLFVVTLSTFDKCLGRVSEVSDLSAPYPSKMLRGRTSQISPSGLPKPLEMFRSYLSLTRCFPGDVFRDLEKNAQAFQLLF
jgi:hypothetical protein